jgi:hypothetical protein
MDDVGRGLGACTEQHQLRRRKQQQQGRAHEDKEHNESAESSARDGPREGRREGRGGGRGEGRREGQREGRREERREGRGPAADSKISLSPDLRCGGCCTGCCAVDGALRVLGQQLHLLEPCGDAACMHSMPTTVAGINVEALPPTPQEVAASEAAEEAGLGIEGVVVGGAFSAVGGVISDTSSGNVDGTHSKTGRGGTLSRQPQLGLVLRRPARYTMRLIDAGALARTSACAASVFFGGAAACSAGISTCDGSEGAAHQSPVADHDAASYAQALHGLAANGALEGSAGRECSEL